MPDVEDYEWEKAVTDEAAAERYIRSISDKKLISDPGTEFHYSNMAYDVMADLVAKVAGISFEKYVKENILTPLQMKESSFYFQEIKRPLRTAPHIGKPATVSPVYPYNRMHAPSSTLNSSVLELAHWAIANLYYGKYKGKQIFEPVTYTLMTTPSFTIDSEKKIAIGLSWFISPYQELTIYEHAGGDVGYKSYLTLVPDKKIGIVLLSNYDEIPMRDVKNKVLDILLSK